MRYLIEGVLDVVVEDVHPVAPDGGVSEPVGVSLEDAGQPLLDNVGPDVQVLELGVALALADDEGGLAHQVRFFSLLSLALPVLFLDLFDDLEGGVQVGARSIDFAGL